MEISWNGNIIELFFKLQHPGGAYVMEDYLGFDATLAFRSVGHSTDALTMLGTFFKN